MESTDDVAYRLKRLALWFEHNVGMMRRNHPQEYDNFTRLVNEMEEQAKTLDARHPQGGGQWRSN